MSKHHDIGGRPAGPVERVEAPPNHWQKRMEAMRDCLARRSPAVMQVDEMRRGIEEMPAADYAAFDSYQRKTVAIRNVLVGKSVLDAAEMEAAIRWLRREKEKDIEAARGLPEHRVHGYDDQADDDDHDDHHHDHALSEEPVMDEYDLISEAMIQGLVARGLLLPGELRAGIERAEMAGPTLGADVVVRAWVDRDFKAALLADGKAAMARIGIGAPSRRRSSQSRTRTTCTTWWSARSVPVIRAQSSAVRRRGTSARPIARPRCANLARCSLSLGSSLAAMSG